MTVSKMKKFLLPMGPGFSRLLPMKCTFSGTCNEYGKSKRWFLGKMYGFLASCHLFHQRAIMENNVRPAERIAHRIARQTKNAIAWTGAVQAFLSALDLLWTLWRLWREGRVDERRRERQDRKDQGRDAAIEQLKNEVKTLRYVHSGASPFYSAIILPFAEQGTGAKLLE